MTTLLASAQKEPIIPIVPKVPHADYKEISLSLERYDPGIGRGAHGHWMKVKENAIFCATTDKEYLLRTIIEFEDLSGDDRMDLDNTVNLKFKYFRQCLGSDVRSSWDTAKDGKPITEAGWITSIVAFLANYFKPSDLTAQKRYMESFKKNHNMSVKVLADRLLTLNMYMEYFPGSTGPTFNDQELKNLLFNAMPLTWQIDFAKAGHDINAVTYQYQQLESYMSNHAVLANVLFESNKSKDGRGGRFGNIQGGRGHGRGGGGRFSGNRRPHNGKPAGQQDYKHQKEMCNMHPGSTHPWSDCCLNPKSPNYNPPPATNTISAGRGGGRGRWSNNSGGRGNGGGRVGRGRGNYSNNRGNQNNNNNNTQNDNFQQDQGRQDNNRQGRNNSDNTAGPSNSQNNNTNNNNNNNNTQDNHWMEDLQW
jgi:hypothetical protein